MSRPAASPALLSLSLLAAVGGCSGAPSGPAPDADPEMMRRGQAVYLRVCSSCHQTDGQGLPGAFPPLAGSGWVAAAPDVPVRIVLHGLRGELRVRGETWDSVMLAHGAALSDAEIADVLSYVRASWGNRAAPISAQEVAAIRQNHADRDAPWTAAELKP